MNKDIKIISDLPVERWQEYKALRLHALLEAPQSFLKSFDEESQKTDIEWQELLKESLEGKSRFFVFAESDGVLIGMMGAFVDTHEKVKHIATIVSVYIEPAFQGKGISSVLMKELLQNIQKNSSITRLDLMVVTTQESAIALYKKFGFETVGTVHKEMFVNGQYYDEHIMEKLL